MAAAPGSLVEYSLAALALVLVIVKRSDDMSGFVVLSRLLWNLIYQVVQDLPWLTATISRSVTVAGTPISRGCCPGRRGNVGQPFQELVECGLAVVDGGAFLVAERDARQHALEVVLVSRSWPLLEVLGV
ncbi:hypothetical protein LKL35_36115 [Streptomyces sp. ET3-23]|uniref:hypothetical protein n=1 Tax=Streptomyces sp. ET3-23 TaxID=2885643 RepID=UPI001D0FC894|nr:hypothetical protein [Streptomyces sp. ET3-23]MCC2280761.1 hypothetical protein [Streptomyces sp. ET3-23]